MADQQLAEVVVAEDVPEMKRRRLRGPRPQHPKRHEFLMSMEPFKMHNPGGGPFVGPPAPTRTESTGQFVPIPSSFQFREEDMIHFDDKAAGAAPSSAAVAAPSFLPRIQAPPELRRNVALSSRRRLMDALKDLE